MKANRILMHLCLLGAMLWPAPTALATTHIVSSLNDNGAGTLRDAITTSVANDTIVFTTTGTITLTTGELLVGHNLTITGPGATNLTVHGSSTNRVFEIATNITVSISSLTISGGNALGTNGGPVGSFPGGSGVGGGILNSGTLALNNCALTNNTARGGTGGTGGSGVGAPGGEADGGGIFNSGHLNLTACAFTRNHVLGGTGGMNTTSSGFGVNNGGAGNGGGIANQGTLTVTNCTFAANTATGGDAGFSETSGNGGLGEGGAIWSSGSSVTMINCTIAGNAAVGGNGAQTSGYITQGGGALGGGLTVLAGGMTLRNVIIAANTVTNGKGETDHGTYVVSYAGVGPDIAGTVTSQGHNLIGETDGSGSWVGSDLTGTIASPLVAQLGPLQNNGGQTLTLALLATSPAIDAGDDAVVSAPYNLTTDQRGVHRPNGFHVDIGAFEFGATVLVTSLADSGLGTLRQAIASAAPGDRITFSPLVTGTVGLTSGELLVSSLLNIIGPGDTNLTISGNRSNRVFHVSPNGTLNLYGLTLTNGSVTGAAGATGAVGGNAIGGGLFNEGIANLSDCLLVSNTATGGLGGTGFNVSSPAGYGAAGGTGAGGGIYNAGLLSLLRCTLANNSAVGGIGGTGGSPLQGEMGGLGGTAFGAGVASVGILTLTNCTLAGNAALAGHGGAGGANQEGGFPGPVGMGGSSHGAGLSIEAGSVTLTSCTISSNSSVFGLGGGSGFFGSPPPAPGSANSGGLFAGATVQVENCLIAGNQATNYPDVDGTVQSGGFNLVGNADGSTGWLVAEGANLGNGSFLINPKLGPLQNNGGTTPTMALLGGSPAIDQGNSFGLTTDQRGISRPADNTSLANASGGDGSDIGAFEVGVTPFLLSLTSYTNKHFQFLLSGPSGSNCIVQANTNLATTNWLSIYTNVSPFTFVDSNASSFPRRFYRGVLTP